MEASQESIPKDFICPITQEVMKDPVIGPDGMTYEKEAITSWLKTHKASPITRQPMDVSQLVPNRALKATIEEMVSSKLHIENIPLADLPNLPELQLELSAVKGDTKSYLQLAVIPPDDGARQPAVFICVIDISGSMNEEATLNTGIEKAPFSRLDLVKHSVKTVACMLSDNDYLGLVAFNEAASTIMPLTRMTELGKSVAKDAIDRLDAEGQTNIWDALRSSIGIVGANPGCRCLNTCILLFTDGIPNVNPPRGIMRSLNNLVKSVPRVFSIHTFGYGYQLDSELLLDIATAGFGSYNYIPDSSMVGTVFINFVSNTLASAAKNVFIILKSEVSKLRGLGFETDVARLQVCSSVYEQRRDLIMEFEPKTDGSFFFEAEMCYSRKSVKKTINSYICVDKLMFNLALSRSLFCDFVLKALAQQISSKKGLEELAKIKPALEALPTKDHEYVKALLRDITSTVESEGQVTKAFSKPDWFDKWGKHYVRSLIRAHQMQKCHNFKDCGVQNYGGKVFREFQDKTEEIFGTLPAPKPSNKIVREGKLLYASAPAPVVYKNVNMRDYIDMSAGCFDGEGLLLLSNGQYKRVKELVKGDEIVNSDGKITKVVALVITMVKNDLELINLNGVLITPWHPVRIAGEWKFPQSLKQSERKYCDVIYNLVLDTTHVATINGLDVVTLGHELKVNKVVEHAYFGSQRVIEDLKKFGGWETGRVCIEKWNAIRDEETGLVNGLA